MAKTSWKHGQLFSVLASNDCYCHPAEGVLASNGFLVHVICLNFLDSATKKSSEVILHMHEIKIVHHASITSYFCLWHSTAPLDWVNCSHKFKLILMAFSDFSRKLAPPKNYPPYGSVCVAHVGYCPSLYTKLLLSILVLYQ